MISFNNYIIWQLNDFILNIIYEILFYYWFGGNWKKHNLEFFFMTIVFDHHGMLSPKRINFKPSWKVQNTFFFFAILKKPRKHAHKSFEIVFSFLDKLTTDFSIVVTL
jgi:hypothetical protein